MNNEVVPISIALTREQARVLRVLAAEEDISRSLLVRQIIDTAIIAWQELPEFHDRINRNGAEKASPDIVG